MLDTSTSFNPNAVAIVALNITLDIGINLGIDENLELDVNMDTNIGFKLYFDIRTSLDLKIVICDTTSVAYVPMRFPVFFQ